MITRRNRREKRHVGGVWFIKKNVTDEDRLIAYHRYIFQASPPLTRRPSPETSTEVNFILYILHRALSLEFLGFLTNCIPSLNNTKSTMIGHLFFIHSNFFRF